MIEIVRFGERFFCVVVNRVMFICFIGLGLRFVNDNNGDVGFDVFGMCFLGDYDDGVCIFDNVMK